MADEFEGMPGIVAIRIDDRLIHGQVVAYWCELAQAHAHYGCRPIRWLLMTCASRF